MIESPLDNPSGVPAPDEWLLVPEAGRRLGISERTAQRYATRLPDTARQVSDKDGLRRVLLSAMVGEYERASVKREATKPRESMETVTGAVAVMTASDGVAAGSDGIVTPDVADVASDGDGPVVSASDVGKDALIAQLQSEVGFLRGALEKEQASVAGLTSELSEARKQSTVLLGAVAAGRLQLASAPVAEPEPNAQTGTEHDNETRQGLSNEAEQRGKWWQVWKR